ncbi:MAG: ankyrin repeat domain-containing protein, partial [Akkermansia sp.]|nr:ankyrin repeat domain-containing protein [Akkermansia sp.]
SHNLDETCFPTDNETTRQYYLLTDEAIENGISVQGNILFITPPQAFRQTIRLQAVDALIKAGANVNAQDEDGNTALMDAADEGHTAVVLRLIQAGADVNARDDEGETALRKAIEERHADTAALLRQYSAK